MIGDKYELYTFNHLMSLALSQVPDTMDKRQGSIIYDALAPACYRLAELYQNVRNVYQDTFAATATGQELRYRVAERGIQPYAATHAIKKAYVTDGAGNPISIPIGSRFSTVSDVNPINYSVVAVYEEDGQGIPGYYQLQCEVPGSVGNEYTGPLTQITYIRGIGAAIMSTLLVPARDEETDDELRSRYFESLANTPYGGNVAQYKQQVGAIPGVGGVQVYPVWNGGGTVKVSIIDAQKNICSPEFIAAVQNQVDPHNADGQPGTGLGLAPIGHKVTVATPDEFSIQIAFNVNLTAGTELGQVSTNIKKAIADYFYRLRTEWDEENNYGQYFLTVYRAQILAAVMAIPGIANVYNLTLNGTDADISLEQTGDTQQIPEVGTIVVNGGVI